MSETFEELAGREVDGLFQGALFLRAGDERAAEDLLLWTLTRAFHAFREQGGGERPDRWLEGRLVHEFLALPRSPGGARAAPAEPTNRAGEVAPVDPDALYRAAAEVPPRARAALWLVVLRRWTYEAAAGSLRTSIGELKDLLRYRHTLMSAVLKPRNGRNGTDGGVS